MGERCWCGSQRPLARCCGPYLAGRAVAPTAEALMRSRYSAFCQANVDYLLDTHHASTKGVSDRTSLAKTIQTTQWANLLIVGTHKGQKKDKTGIVEFVAVYRNVSVPTALTSGAEAAPLQQLHEKSRFVKEKGRWFYTDGDILPPYLPKPSAPCWCGSSQPFKHCHAKR